ncbi:helix-turn-helix domain-containing protein [Dysgonomonas sp. ZJ709]|uniref:helix-turn-helix domain-containing protein n=1 Tax=Dysgonomonas sp. ZJ709 TaxID=2709797 RepID=UPI0013EA6EB1|nr:helix-turn-helix transcriptional regulator [Dysgonomonas sp. ZJ709]
METGNTTTKRVHHGHNIKRLRESRGMKQETIADVMDLAQQTISKYESKRTLDDDILKKFAEALNVSVDTLKEMEEDPVTIIFENNIIENNNGSIKAYVEEDNSTNTFNPVDKIVELCERMLQADQEKIALLEQLLKEKK